MDRFIWGILRHRKAVVSAFVAVALFCACLIPFVKVNYDLADYLPPEAQSTTAVEIMSEQFTQPIPNAYVMVRDVSVSEALEVKAELLEIDGVESVMWLDDMVDLAVPLESADQETVEGFYCDETALFQVSVTEGEEGDVIPVICELVDAMGPDNAVSGQAMENADMQAGTVEQVLLACAIALPIILALLFASTMSWIEPILFLAAIGVSILINMGTNLMFENVSFLTNSVSPILQLAVSLDYAIFLLHAFAAERKTEPDVERAMACAMRKSTSTIAASAVTTLFGFAALSFMQFQIGADLGLNLVKGVALSFVTVVVFLPALTVLMCNVIDKTTHRSFLPSFANIGRPLSKVRIPALVLVLVLLLPAFLGQMNTTFTYQNTGNDASMRSGRDTMAVNAEFGEQNACVVLVPRGDVASEALLSADLADLDNVTTVMSYANTVGATIPQEFLDPAILEQFYSDDWARIIAYIDAPTESDAAFSTIEAVQDIAGQYYDTYYMAGQSANLYDMKEIVAVDNVVVSLVAMVTIFLVVMLTFRSLMLPICLVLTIEAGIWINLAIPYYLGQELNFIGYLVINTVQLGATIDYGILLTTHYLRERKVRPAREAVFNALGSSVPSLIVSAGILAGAGIALSVSSSLSAVATLGLLLARGACFSLILVTCFLPALLVYCDGLIRRTTWRAGFYLPASSEGASHE